MCKYRKIAMTKWKLIFDYIRRAVILKINLKSLMLAVNDQLQLKAMWEM